MNVNKKIEFVFEGYLEKYSEQTAAILTLAWALKSLTEDEGEHTLCMGVRHGLFGADAQSNATVEVIGA